uniref:Uncharacterized protein n=1 Tax=Eubacterium cellulosolvens (strain ATCC 43171 / JCM 9499 / 6) TaxID=633697 RepID=I5AS17_EUBC6
MGRLKKVIVALLVIVLLATTIVAVRVQLETRKKTRDAKFDHFIYARNFACVLSSCTRKGSEYEYTLEKTPNTDAVIEYLQKDGYPITYEIVVTDYEKGMDVLKRFCKDHELDKIESVRSYIVSRLGSEGYTWAIEDSGEIPVQVIYGDD